MEKLIGKKFKRNVYGLSNWVSIIKEVNITKELIVNKQTKTVYYAPKIWIKSEKGISYELNEIVIIVENSKLIQLAINLAEKGKIKTF